MWTDVESLISRVRVRASGQELYVFCCHICHRLYDNPLFFKVIGWMCLCFNILRILPSLECSFCPHKTLLFHLRFFHSSSPFITTIFFPCDRCDSKKAQLARECARVVRACVRMHADAHSSSQESLSVLSHLARLCHWLQFLVSPFWSFFAMLSFQFVLIRKFFGHFSAIFSLFEG